MAQPDLGGDVSRQPAVWRRFARAPVGVRLGARPCVSLLGAVSPLPCGACGVAHRKKRDGKRKKFSVWATTCCRTCNCSAAPCGFRQTRAQADACAKRVRKGFYLRVYRQWRVPSRVCATACGTLHIAHCTLRVSGMTALRSCVVCVQGPLACPPLQAAVVDNRRA